MIKAKWFVLVMATFATIGPSLALGADRTNGACKANQVELFSCIFRSGQLAGICFNKISAKMEYVAGRRNDPVMVGPLSHVQEAILGDNPHGDVIVVKASVAKKTIELFVDGDYYDLQAPLLLTIVGSRVKHDECQAGTYVDNAAVVSVHGKARALNLFTLLQDGVATELPDPPEWPGLSH